MSKLFPELDRELTRHTLRDGVRVDIADGPTSEIVSTLEKMGLIGTTQRRYVKCAYRSDPDYLERWDSGCEGIIEVDDLDKSYFCRECGQPIEQVTKKTFFGDVRVSLEPDGITQHIREAVQAVPHVARVDSLAYSAFSVQLTDGRTIKLVVLDYTEARYRFAGLYFAEPHLYVVASPINDPVRHVLEGQIYVALLSRKVSPFEGQFGTCTDDR